MREICLRTSNGTTSCFDRHKTLRLVRTAEMFEKQAPLTDADFAVFYEALTGKLDAIYSQWDKMIVARNLATAEATFQDARVEVSDDNVATLYFSDEKILPFDFQSVNDACWVCAKMDSLTEEDRGGITDVSCGMRCAQSWE